MVTAIEATASAFADLETLDLMGLPENVIHYVPNLRQVLPCSKGRLRWLQVSYGGGHIPAEEAPSEFIIC